MTWITTVLFFLSTFGNCTITDTNIEKHPIYTSVTEVDYKEDRKVLEISTKIFVDDLERYFKKREGEAVEIGTSREHPKADKFLADYFKKHLHFYADGKKLEYIILGKEMGGQQNIFDMYIFIEIKDVATFSSLTVKNSLLINSLPRQLNFVACHTNKGLIKKIARKGRTEVNFPW